MNEKTIPSTIRIPESLDAEIRSIIEKIERENPEVEVSISTVARYALKDYVRRYSGRFNKDTMFLEIPIDGLTDEELTGVWDAVCSIGSIIENHTVGDRGNKFIESLNEVDSVYFNALNKNEQLALREKAKERYLKKKELEKVKASTKKLVEE